MEYTISTLRHQLSDFDQETMLFWFEVHPKEQEDLAPFPYFVHLSDVLYALRDKNHPFYDYYNSVRNGLDHWGPSDAATLEALGDEAVAQLYEHAEAYILQLPYMDKVLEQERKIQSEKRPSQSMARSLQAEKVHREMSTGLSEMQKEQQRYYLFCETVSRFLRETAVNVYPELLDAEPEQIRELQHLFNRDIISIHDKLDDLLHK